MTRPKRKGPLDSGNKENEVALPSISEFPGFHIFKQPDAQGRVILSSGPGWGQMVVAQMESPQKKRKVIAAAKPKPVQQAKQKDGKSAQTTTAAGEDRPFRFLDLPDRAIDLVLALDFTISDYFALAGTCKALRLALSENMFERLMDTKFSKSGDSKLYVDPRRELLTLWSNRERRVASSGLHHGRSCALNVAQCDQISTTAAKSTWKIAAKDLARLTPISAENRRADVPGHKPLRGVFYYEAAVRAAAYRAHGGPLGHIHYLITLFRRAEQAKRTRDRNGTSSVIGPYGMYQMRELPYWDVIQARRAMEGSDSDEGYDS